MLEIAEYMRAAKAGTKNMGSTRAALICQLMSGDLVVIIAYPTAAICSRKKKYIIPSLTQLTFWLQTDNESYLFFLKHTPKCVPLYIRRKPSRDRRVQVL
jgi:hypothetical protein